MQELETAETYEGGPLWKRDVEDARENFEVTVDLPNGNTHYVEAKAGNASRFVVLASWLSPEMRDRQDCTVVMAVLQPFQAVVRMTHYDQTLDVAYLRKKLEHAPEPLHGGDLMGVAMSIAHILEQHVR